MQVIQDFITLSEIICTDDVDCFRQINLLTISADSSLLWNVHLLPLQQIWKRLSWQGDLLSYHPVRWVFSALSNVNKHPGRSFPEDNIWHLYI